MNRRGKNTKNKNLENKNLYERKTFTHANLLFFAPISIRPTSTVNLFPTKGLNLVDSGIYNSWQYDDKEDEEERYAVPLFPRRRDRYRLRSHHTYVAQGTRPHIHPPHLLVTV